MALKDLQIRSETPADQAAIHALHAASFPTADEANLVDALRTAGNLTISLVAEQGDQIVSHVAFSPVSLQETDRGLGLAPVATLADFQQRGIADQLIRHGLKLCQQHSHPFVVVLGNPKYYSRFGFQPASHFALRDEYGGGDAFQALELQPNSLPKSGGLVLYAPEFAAL